MKCRVVIIYYLPKKYTTHKFVMVSNISARSQHLLGSISTKQVVKEMHARKIHLHMDHAHKRKTRGQGSAGQKLLNGMYTCSSKHWEANNTFSSAKICAKQPGSMKGASLHVHTCHIYVLFLCILTKCTSCLHMFLSSEHLSTQTTQ